ncbi:ABC transporter substrate-binding protein [Demequina aestuarii]|uniref:ABC transporter substrate-binding protein n=1 Tax=Demequina aestuarii TaxID=327095 RepID=UPI0007808DFA|nr:ABC transporter substrate-binding protein [Demequina aestuarii]
MNPRQTIGAASFVAALTLSLTACAGSGGDLPGETAESGSDATDIDTTLTMALTSDISTPDPSSAYSGSEMNVVLAAYEGLVKYQTGVDTAEIVPSLATEWEVSEDGLTYTFQLREGVTFHDGTPFTSAAVEPSIARMLEEGASGPAYLVDGISSIETPSQYELVVTLDAPNSALLDYLASPFGLKIISPAALEEHGDDAEWFASNDAGTGPFEYGSFNAGTQYELTAYEGYWGELGGYDTIEYTIVDSTNTVQLQLESGELDGYIGSANKILFDGLSEVDGLQTHLYPSMMAPVVFLNPASEFFADSSTRSELLSGIDWDGIVTTVFGDLATASDGVFPASMIDPNVNTSALSFDEAALAGLADGALEGENIEIGYPSFVPGAQDIADNVAAQLNTVGISTESIGLESSAYWSTVFDPAVAPDITLFSAFPDAAHPDTWARLFYSDGGGLNLFSGSIDGLGDLLDEAAKTGDEALYADVTERVSSSGLWLTLADLTVSSAFQDSVEGAADASYPVLGITVDFTTLSPSS